MVYISKLIYEILDLCFLGYCSNNFCAAMLQRRQKTGWYACENSGERFCCHCADSTIYGIVLESGMSTLCIRTYSGDTLVMDRDDEQGYGEIYGYVEEGDTFAVTKRKGKYGLVVVKAYNLSQLKGFNANLSVRNGLLVVGGNDTVDVSSVDDDSLVVISRTTKRKQAFYQRKR